MIDIHSHIGAVDRQVRAGERDGRETKVVVAQRTYPSPVEDVWDAITSAERIPRWFMPVSGDLRPGGRFQLEGNAGGEILACDPPRSLQVTWGMGDEVSWVDVRLVPEGAGTTLRLEHTAHVPPEFWDQFGPGAVGVGWESGLLGLALHLADGASVAPEFVGWEATDEGQAFFAAASDGWGEAAVRAGADEAEAKAAAERTTQFYTGMPAEGAAG